jgi:hypothetical protein
MIAGRAGRLVCALAAHDPSHLPLARDVKYTQTGGIGVHAVLKERGLETLMSLRLKVEAGLITEVETLQNPGDSKIVGYQQEDLTEPSRFDLLAEVDRCENGILPMPRYEAMRTIDRRAQGETVSGASRIRP